MLQWEQESRPQPMIFQNILHLTLAHTLLLNPCINLGQLGHLAALSLEHTIAFLESCKHIQIYFAYYKIIFQLPRHIAVYT